MFERLVAFLRGLARRRRIRVELEEEMQFHLEQRVDLHVSRELPLANSGLLPLCRAGFMHQRRSAAALHDTRSSVGSDARVRSVYRSRGRQDSRGLTMSDHAGRTNSPSQRESERSRDGHDQG